MLALLFCLPFLARASNAFGTNFLEANKQKAGVVTLPSGLQYKVLRVGNGSFHPTIRSSCVCHYAGRTAENYPSGPKFDSSYDRGGPATFQPRQVIRGWTEALQIMVEGDKWELYIPSDLGYGEKGHPPKIPGKSVLVFTIELIQIYGRKEPRTKLLPFRLVFNVANLVGEPSESSFTMQVQPDWAPIGAKRLQELAETSFFDDLRFFRVINGFMAQFGIHGDPAISRQWRDRKIKDDAKLPGVGNKRGKVSFATAGPDTRTTQLFINFQDNDALDGMGFTPVAEVVEGMDVVDRLFKVGEGAPRGPGPDQGYVQSKGNAYLREQFPKLSYVKSCRLIYATQAHGPLPTANVSEAQDLGSGLKLRTITAGDGKTFPHAGDLLTMHYTVSLAGDSRAKVIDSSRSRHQPFTFRIGRGQVIDGWDQGVMQMSLGQRGILTVPSDLAYGAAGAGKEIPPNANLVFDVEVLGINQAGRSSLLGVLLLAACPCLLGLILFRSRCGFCTSGPGGDKATRPVVEMAIGKTAAE